MFLSSEGARGVLNFLICSMGGRRSRNTKKGKKVGKKDGKCLDIKGLFLSGGTKSEIILSFLLFFFHKCKKNPTYFSSPLLHVLLLIFRHLFVICLNEATLTDASASFRTVNDCQTLANLEPLTVMITTTNVLSNVKNLLQLCWSPLLAVRLQHTMSRLRTSNK